MTEEAPTIRRGRSTATGGRGIVSPLFVAVTAALAGFGLWVWITGPGTSVPVALVGFVVAVICGRAAFSAMAKPAEDDDEIPNKLDDIPPEPPGALGADPVVADAQADVGPGEAGPAEEPRGADAPPVPEGTPPTLDGAVVDPPPPPSTVIPFPAPRATETKG